MSDAPCTPIAAAHPAGDLTNDPTLARQTRRTFGHDVAVEASYLRDSVGVVDLGWRDLLAVNGADALSFLHRMLTQDFNTLAPGASRRSALLVRKGQLVAEFLATRPAEATPDEVVWFSVSSGRAAALAGGLDPFVITEDVVFRPLDATHTTIWLVGPRAVELHAAAGSPSAVRHDLGALPGMLLRLTHAAARDLWPTLGTLAGGMGGGFAGFDAFEMVRIEQGLGRYGVDWDDQVLPKEAGLDDCISYTKGCFVGQEPTARLHFRGQPARRLMRLTIAGTTPLPVLPPPGTPLTDAAGKEAGVLTSVAWSSAQGIGVALGYVKRAHIDADPPVALRVGDGNGAEVTITNRPPA
ncbi:MAG: folate-binding protein YgfZ [Planctomycetota bacterium]